jgi:hypothetical protein
VTVACKAEAKAMNLWWLKNRKYVKNCIERTALQDRAPSMSPEAATRGNGMWPDVLNGKAGAEIERILRNWIILLACYALERFVVIPPLVCCLKIRPLFPHDGIKKFEGINVLQG